MKAHRAQRESSQVLWERMDGGGERKGDTMKAHGAKSKWSQVLWERMDCADERKGDREVSLSAK